MDTTYPPGKMRAMVLHQVGHPLIPGNVDIPVPDADQVLLKVIACGISWKSFFGCDQFVNLKPCYAHKGHTGANENLHW